MNAVVTLTEAEAAADDRDAERDYARPIKYDWNKTGFLPAGERRLMSKKMSYRAEHALAKALGDPDWRRDPDGFGKADVRHFSVRFTWSVGNGDLVVHESDQGKPYPFILAETKDGLTFTFVGWLEPEQAQELRDLKIGRPLGGTTNPWGIPRDLLRPIESLPA